MAQILVAEDDDSMRAFLAGALRRAGHAVETAADGFEALSCLARHKYDVLLADVVMPGMDGVELARRASRDQPQIKVMFITGFAAVALNSDSEAPKNAKVLAKPVHLRELVSEVNKMLAA